MKFRIVKRAWWLHKKIGMCLWPFLWFRSEEHMMTDWVFRHELEHCYQCKRMGRFKFYASYLWLYLRYGYRKHPYELEAKAVQEEPLTQEEQRWRLIRKVVL